MHAMEILQKYFKKSLPQTHVKRQDRLFIAVESLLASAKLTITSLGRHTKGVAKVKNKIKAVDRLLKNEHLLVECIEYYQMMAKKLIGNLESIDIIVDWSPAGNHENHLLRASIALEGRSMTLYEEVHKEKKLGNYKVHKKFLDNLKKVLPVHAKPIIVTDAGFRAEWFEMVQRQGWHFEGRTHSNMLYLMKDEFKWKKLTGLYRTATKKAQYVGHVKLTKSRALPCEMYIYEENKENKKKNKKRRKQRSKKCEARYTKQHRTPWVLVTSVPHRITRNSNKIITRYKRRMKIEHEFRNAKNSKWGLGLNETKTRNPARLAILLLISAIGMLALWLLGSAGEHKKMHLDYQSNTVKKRRVLSLIFLGLQIILHELHKITKADLKEVFYKAQNEESSFYSSGYSYV